MAINLIQLLHWYNQSPKEVRAVSKIYATLRRARPPAPLPFTSSLLCLPAQTTAICQLNAMEICPSEIFQPVLGFSISKMQHLFALQSYTPFTLHCRTLLRVATELCMICSLSRHPA
jgi:hypothetical protein